MVEPHEVCTTTVSTTFAPQPPETVSSSVYGPTTSGTNETTSPCAFVRRPCELAGLIFEFVGTDLSLQRNLKSSPMRDGVTMAVAVARVKSDPDSAGSFELIVTDGGALHCRSTTAHTHYVHGRVCVCVRVQRQTSLLHRHLHAPETRAHAHTQCPLCAAVAATK